MTRLFLLTLFALPLAACDSGGPDPDPGPATALVAVDVVAFEAFGNCESDSNPGDFQFQAAIVDAGNNTLSSTDFPTGVPYGTRPNGTVADIYEFTPRQRRAVDGTVSAERPRDVSGSFGVRFSGMEWDTATTRDARFDDVQQVRSYPYEAGLFQRVAGEQSIMIGTTSDCRVEMEYRITIQ